MLTAALRLADARPDLAAADHAEALGLVERADLLLGLAERHAVLHLAQLGLGVGLLRLARPVRVYDQWKLRKRRSGRCHLLPPRRFFGPSFGMGSALTIFAGGGAARRSMCFSIFSRRSCP